MLSHSYSEGVGGQTIIEKSKHHGEDILTKSYYSPTSPCQHVSYMDTSATESFPGLGHAEISTNSKLNDLYNRDLLHYGQRTLNEDPSEQIHINIASLKRTLNS